jgi:CRP/FNR family cyclic AMP-dependent transcriptional regulator
VLSAASKTGRLLILKEGAVAVVKEGVEIARVAEPGAVFGELSVLLDQPHTADVRALEASQFHVADARSRSFAWQPYWHSVSTAPIGGFLS